jgi:DHA1 family multidrug resistance protein-like MFS transporter
LEVSLKKLLIPSLALAVFLTFTLDLLAQLFLVDISSTFDVTRGVASQIQLTSSLAAIIFALLISALSIRFRYKSLLIVGVLCIVIGGIGCFLAPTFGFMQVFFPLNGVGSAMVIPMAIALIGEIYTLDKRAKAIAWITAAGGSVAFVAVPAMGLLAQLGTWRTSLLGFVLPVSIIALMLAFFVLPSFGKPKTNVKEQYLSSYKQILLNRSASTCLIGAMLHSFVPVMGAVFGVAFFRDTFSLSSNFGIGLLIGFAVFYTIGGLAAGRLVNRFGRKKMTSMAVLMEGICTILFAALPFFPLALAFSFSSPFFGGMAATSISSLVLEQAPKSRGTMMSLRSAFGNLGILLAVAVGGVVLDGFGYPVVGILLGTVGILAASIFYFLTKDTSQISY